MIMFDESTSMNRDRSQFFAICKECGGIEYVTIARGRLGKIYLSKDELEEETKEILNWLQSDGSTNLKQLYSDILFRGGEVFCNYCESPCQIVLFYDVKPAERKEIFKMSPEERMEWVKKYQMFLTLKK